MPLSVQPLKITYSFAANRRSATDKINAVALDQVLATLAGKLNEIITAVNVTLRDDDTLVDQAILPRHLSLETLEKISAMINAKVTPP